ncbi:MAG: hypothetical protein ACLRL6_12055 [Clostridium sp.]
MLTIDGGTIYVDADGDGVDSNQDIVMNDGTLIVMGPESGGNGALDYDGSFVMNGERWLQWEAVIWRWLLRPPVHSPLL